MRSLSIALILFANAAQAQTLSIDGTYGDDGGCDMAMGRAVLTDLAIAVTATTVDRYETSCDIIAITSQTDTTVKFDTTCFGEGEEWPQSFVMMSIPGKDAYRIGPADAPEILFDIVRCQ